MHGTRWLPDDSPTELARVRQPAPPGIIVHNGAIADDEMHGAEHLLHNPCQNRL